jgi:hypothetical protein
VVTGLHAAAQHAQWQRKKAFVKTGVIFVPTQHIQGIRNIHHSPAVTYWAHVIFQGMRHAVQILFVLYRTSR